MPNSVRAALILAAVLGAGGCASEVDQAPVPPNDDGFLGPAPCVACVESACGLELRTCDVDPECRMLRACRARCNDVACDSACLDALPADSPARGYMRRLAVCAADACPSDCTPEPVPAERIDECTALFDAAVAPEVSSECAPQRDCACRQCNSEWLACLADPLCAEKLGCSLQICKLPYELAPCSACFPRATVPALAAAHFCGITRCRPCSLATSSN